MSVDKISKWSYLMDIGIIIIKLDYIKSLSDIIGIKMLYQKIFTYSTWYNIISCRLLRYNNPLKI